MSSRRRCAAVVAVLSLAAAVAVAGQQQPPPVFSAGNRTVAVYATVTDTGGRLIPDLERAAFSVDDNGKRQELTLFANEVQPITAVMLLDRSGSMRANFDLVEQAAEQFVNAMLPADQARIGSFSNRIQIDPRDFTSDHDELLKILKTELQPEGPTPLWNAVNVGITALLHQQGRRVILVFTDGVDAPMNFSNNNHSLKDVMKRAEEENVMVYAIGLAGNNSPAAGGGYPGGGHPGGGWGGGGRMPGGHGRGMGGWGGPRGGFGGRPNAVDDKPDEGLPKIAAATGGGYFELTSTSDLASTFSRVADELHHQYALGFTPQALDGKMHSLAVHIAQAGVTVRARKSYLAARPAGSE
jgi:VWFA-related protein